jgi:hypothetical protein
MTQANVIYAERLTIKNKDMRHVEFMRKRLVGVSYDPENPE